MINTKALTIRFGHSRFWRVKIFPTNFYENYNYMYLESYIQDFFSQRIFHRIGFVFGHSVLKYYPSFIRAEVFVHDFRLEEFLKKFFKFTKRNIKRRLKFRRKFFRPFIKRFFNISFYFNKKRIFSSHKKNIKTKRPNFHYSNKKNIGYKASNNFFNTSKSLDSTDNFVNSNSTNNDGFIKRRFNGKESNTFSIDNFPKKSGKFFSRIRRKNFVHKPYYKNRRRKRFGNRKNRRSIFFLKSFYNFFPKLLSFFKKLKNYYSKKINFFSVSTNLRKKLFRFKYIYFKFFKFFKFFIFIFKRFFRFRFISILFSRFNSLKKFKNNIFFIFKRFSTYERRKIFDYYSFSPYSRTFKNNHLLKSFSKYDRQEFYKFNNSSISFFNLKFCSYYNIFINYIALNRFITKVFRLSKFKKIFKTFISNYSFSPFFATFFNTTYESPEDVILSLTLFNSKRSYINNRNFISNNFKNYKTRLYKFKSKKNIKFQVKFKSKNRVNLFKFLRRRRRKKYNKIFLPFFSRFRRLSYIYFKFFRFKFFKFVCSFFSRNLNTKFLGLPVKLFIRVLPAYRTTVNIFLRYFITKLFYRYMLGDVLNPIVKTSIKRFRGFTVVANGRFTRAQMASHRHYKRGSVSFSSISIPIDYNQMCIPLKYGTCNLKLWIRY